MISLFLVDCNKMDLLYRNRWVGLLAVTVEILIEHVQVMSYGKRMVDPVYYTFNTKAFDTFDGMEISPCASVAPASSPSILCS